MRLFFIYGPPASGKLTIGRMVADRTGLALFHNHLIVDAVVAVFPFGSEQFVQLRERFWLDMVSAAAHAGRSMIFTFAPEPTVAPDFPARLYQAVENAGGEVLSVALGVEDADQEKRLVAADRASFGKLQSLDLLRELRPGLHRLHEYDAACHTEDRYRPKLAMSGSRRDHRANRCAGERSLTLLMTF